jgi:hypothetical protein
VIVRPEGNITVFADGVIAKRRKTMLHFEKGLELFLSKRRYTFDCKRDSVVGVSEGNEESGVSGERRVIGVFKEDSPGPFPAGIYTAM